MTTYASVLDRITEGRQLPDGCDAWAFKSVRPDGSTYQGYRWPLAPGWVEAVGPFAENGGPCPSWSGDGLCYAWTHRGMASGGIPARTVLLLAYAKQDVLGAASGGAAEKGRARRLYVADVLDGEAVVRHHGNGAYLAHANLTGANLAGANLTGAYLAGAIR